MTFFIALEIVLWWKSLFMRHFYSPCFEYLEKGIFSCKWYKPNCLFLKGISNLIKKWKFKFCKLSKAFCMNLSHIIDLKSHLQALHQDFAKWHKLSDSSLMGASSYIFTQMTRLTKWRKLSDPSFMGVLSRFCKMTQTVRPFIYGCLRRFVLKSWWSSHTICVILQNHDEAPINEGSDNLRHFKSRVSREKNILYDYAW